MEKGNGDIEKNQLSEKMLANILGEGSICCSPDLVELKNTLSKNLQEERDASSHYLEVAVKFAHQGYLDLAKQFKSMSEQEFDHYTKLIATHTMLNHLCACGGPNG